MRERSSSGQQLEPLCWETEVGDAAHCSALGLWLPAWVVSGSGLLQKLLVFPRMLTPCWGPMTSGVCAQCARSCVQDGMEAGAELGTRAVLSPSSVAGFACHHALWVRGADSSGQGVTWSDAFAVAVMWETVWSEFALRNSIYGAELPDFLTPSRQWNLSIIPHSIPNQIGGTCCPVSARAQQGPVVIMFSIHDIKTTLFVPISQQHFE